METLDFFIFGQDSQIAKTHEHPIMKTYFKEKQEEIVSNEFKLGQSTFDTLSLNMSV